MNRKAASILFVIIIIISTTFPISIGTNKNKDFDRNDSGWSLTEVISIDDGDPQDYASSFIIDNEGTIHVVWSNNTYYGSITPAVLYRSRQPNGSWNDIEIIDTHNYKTYNKPIIGIGMNNSIHVIYTERMYNPTRYEIYIQSKEINNSWSNPELISKNDSGFKSTTPDMKIDNDGTIHVVWTANIYNEQNHTWDYQIVYKYKEMNRNWSEYEIVSLNCVESSSYPSIDVDSFGNVHVVWQDESNINGAGDDQDIFYSYKEYGNQWSNPELISIESTLDSSSPSISIDKYDTIHIVWSDKWTINDYPYDTSIYYKNKKPNQNWSNLEVIYSKFNSDGYTPKSIIDYNGTIHVVWKICDEGIFYKFKKESGNWTQEELVSKESTNQYSTCYPSILTNNNGIIHFTWKDRSDYNGAGLDSDIFYKTKLAIPDITIDIGSESEDVYQSESFNFTVTITNNEDTAQVLNFWTTYQRYPQTLNGPLYAKGPFTINLSPGETRIFENISQNASVIYPGMYLYRASIGSSINGAIWGGDHIIGEVLQVVSNPPNKPIKPFGDEELTLFQNGSFTSRSIDPDGDKVQIRFEFETDSYNPDLTCWSKFVLSGENVTVEYSWDEPGYYKVKAQARDIYGTESSWSDSFYVNVINQIPLPPTITGTNQGMVGEDQEFEIMSVDPDNQKIKYYIDWDNNGYFERCTPWQNSGDPVNISNTWIYSGIYEFAVKAMDESYDYSNISYYTIEIINNPPIGPIIDGPLEGNVGIEQLFNITATDPDGHNLSYHVDWDDGKDNNYGPFESGVSFHASHTWEDVGIFNLIIQVHDGYDGINSTIYEIIIYNYQSPSEPEIQGPNEAEINQEVCFTISSEDPDGHELTYTVDWDDGTDNNYGPFASGNDFEACHTWDKTGLYTITVTVDDGFGGVNSSTHEIIIDGAVLEIGEISGGLLKVDAEITNTGTIVAINVTYNLHLIGGILGNIDITEKGSITSLESGDGEVITTSPVFGLGPIEILVTVNADNAEEVTKNVEGFVFFFFVKISN